MVNMIKFSAVTVTEPKNVFFVRTVENRNRVFLERSEYSFAVRRLYLYMVESHELIQVKRLKVPSKSLARLNFPI